MLTSRFLIGPSQVVDSIAIMTGHLLQYNDTTGTYWIHNMTDPDEYANNVDNGAFTIASASQLLQQVNQIRETEGLEVNATWKEQAENIEFPRASSNITLEYQTMDNNVEVKQADVVLLTYPLDFGQGYTTANGLLDLDYVRLVVSFIQKDRFANARLKVRKQTIPQRPCNDLLGLCYRC